MSKALNLANSLIEVHNGHADEGPSIFTEAAEELRRLAADNEQMRNDLLTAKDALSLLERYEYASATIALRIALFT